MTLEQEMIAVLRGSKRCRPAIVGNVHFYHFWKHSPRQGMVNVPWVKDLRVKQFAMNGYVEDYLLQATRYLLEDRRRFAPANAFVAPTPSFADEVMRWYGQSKPWFQFANYPDHIKVPGGERRQEVAYLDYASTVFQEEFYLRLIAFFDELHALTGATGVIVANAMLERIRALPHRAHIQILGIRGEYDCRSRFGLLCNLTNFQQAAECLPRKLLFYLHCGMVPLLHGTFLESIQYCRHWGVQPTLYYGVKDAAQHVEQAAWPSYDREQFCIGARIGDLVGQLKRLGGVG